MSELPPKANVDQNNRSVWPKALMFKLVSSCYFFIKCNWDHFFQLNLHLNGLNYAVLNRYLKHLCGMDRCNFDHPNIFVAKQNTCGWKTNRWLAGHFSKICKTSLYKNYDSDKLIATSLISCSSLLTGRKHDRVYIYNLKTIPYLPTNHR